MGRIGKGRDDGFPRRFYCTNADIERTKGGPGEIFCGFRHFSLDRIRYALYSIMRRIVRITFRYLGPDPHIEGALP